MCNCLGGLAKLKEGEEAEELYRQAIKKSSKPLVWEGAYKNAFAYSLKGNKTKAIEYLEISLKNNEITPDIVINDEDWESLFQDDEFKKLLKKYKD